MNAPGRIHARLNALERHLHPDSGTCAECAGPRPGSNLLVCVRDDGTSRWGACGTCGLALREDGRPMSPIGLVNGKRLACAEVFGPDRWWMYDAV